MTYYGENKPFFSEMMVMSVLN